MNINGYETITSFWSDFTIADRFGVNAIKDTYKRAFNEWKKLMRMRAIISRETKQLTSFGQLIKEGQICTAIWTY